MKKIILGGIRSLTIFALLGGILCAQDFRSFWSDNLETMTLVRKLPPVADVSNVAVKIEASATSSSTPKEVLDTLIVKIRGFILKDRERAIRLEDPNPDYILRCVLTGFELVERKRSETNGNDTATFVNVIGNIEATVTVLDNHNRAIDSDNLKHHYEKEFTENVTGGKTVFGVAVPGRKKASTIRPPTQLERYSLVLEGLALKVAQRLVPIPRMSRKSCCPAAARSGNFGSLPVEHVGVNCRKKPRRCRR